MIVALIDNGSLEPPVHRNLRTLAADLSARTGVSVRAVSWKHSDRICDHDLDGTPAWTLNAFLRSFVALGQRDFIFVPFFLSAEGAIGSALRRDIETLQGELGAFDFTFTEGLSDCRVVPSIVAERVRDTQVARGLSRPAVIVVDHGGPSAISAGLRDELAAQVREKLADDASVVAAASMEGAHPPLLADVLRDEKFAGQDVVVAPLFLAPGRHAGPEGDLVRICRSCHSRSHLTELVGTHPLVLDALAAALRTTLSSVHAHSFA